MTYDEACTVLGIEPGTDYVTAHRAYRSRARESHRDTASPGRSHSSGRRDGADQCGVAAAAVVVMGAGLAATQLGGETAGPQDDVGACLDAEGGVVDCGGSTASVEVLEQVTTAGDCEGPVFADTTGATFFCTKALDA